MMNRDAMGKQVGAFGPGPAKKKAKPFRPGKPPAKTGAGVKKKGPSLGAF